ncbi:MAG: acyltransferase family protein [Hyphomicrobiaceae bacterium]|jgi:peptidoglycan/LPS O-acetylase OafA/YrhL
MLGTTRFLLSLIVIANHFWVAGENMLGFHAVTAFYIVSGFLMTRVIQNVYGLHLDGIRVFLINRLLRIMPAYWLFLLLSLLLIAVLPPRFGFGNLQAAPQSAHDWIANLTLIDLVWANRQVVPPAWSLGIEIVFYALMPIALARSVRSVEIWVVASGIITAGLLLAGVGFGYRYYPAYAASLFISLGAACYTHGHIVRRLTLPRWAIAPALVLFLFLPILVEQVGVSHLTWGYYGAALLFCVLLASMTDGTPSPWPTIDRWLGDLSYPVYLSQFIGAGLVNVTVGDLIVPGTLAYTGAAAAISIAMSAIYVIAVDRPVQRLRARLRPTQPARESAAQWPKL